MDLTHTNKKQKRDKRNTDISHLVYGKVPPQAKDLEAMVLGAIMLEPGVYDRAADLLKPEHFYVDAHQRIYRGMASLSQKSQPIDMHTILEELKRKEELDLVGGPYFITKLTDRVVSSANIEAYGKIIIQKFIQRELIRISSEVLQDAYEDSADAFDLLDEAQESFGNIGMSLDFGDMIGIDVVLIEACKKIEEWRQMDTSITGVPSGFDMLDKATRGWQNGDLIIIAARPSVGKTALALNVVVNAAIKFIESGQNKSVAVWSLEMKALMLVLRMIASQSGELLHKIQTGRLQDDEMNNIYIRAVQKLATLGIFFDDKSGLTIQKLRAKARKLKRKNNLGLIVVDYLQLMTPEEKSGNREQEVSKISRNLKSLAQELDIPIIALSQLSREVERRTGANRKPQLSDLRESGSLEQDADVVCFLWAPTEEEIANDASLMDRRYLRIAKQRNGVLITVDLDFKDEIQRFNSLSTIPGLKGNFKQINYTDHTESKSSEEDYF